MGKGSKIPNFAHILYGCPLNSNLNHMLPVAKFPTFSISFVMAFGIIPEVNRVRKAWKQIWACRKVCLAKQRA